MDTEALSPSVDHSNQRYPFSIVWGPLGPLTCCCPCVGHMGIVDSKGMIHDFNGVLLVMKFIYYIFLTFYMNYLHRVRCYITNFML